MAEKKADLLEKAKELGVVIDPKAKLADIKQALELAEAEHELEAEKAAVEPEEATPPNKAEIAEETEESKTEQQVGPAVEALTAKAGKRSAKAQKEETAKQAKKERKAQPAEDDTEQKPKAQSKPRPLIERRGKKYREAHKLIEKDKLYGLEEAVNLAQKTSTTKFDASLELHVNLGVDPRQADQNIRSTVNLPNGTGKTVRIAVFGNEDDVKAAQAAGADIAGSDDFLEQLKKGVLNFDVLIATPETMGRLGQFAKLLGPKGLMPNPKSGTVTKDVKKAVAEAKAGRVEFRVDKQSIIHCAIGKVGFKPEALLENARAVIKAIQDARPASVKAAYMQRASLTTTMGPGIKLDLKNL